MLEQAQRCSLCGTSDWEWMENPDSYEAVWHDCMGCKHKEGFRNSEGDQNVAGRSVVLKSREEADRLRLDPTVPRHGPRKRRTRPKRTPT